MATSAVAVLEHLPRVMDFVRRHMRHGRTKGLSVPQLRVLIRADQRGTLGDIAACLGITLPTASRIVSGLVAKGYLHRAECTQDRRVRNLSLTPRGQRVLHDAYAATQQAIENELAKLSPADCRGIGRSMRVLGRLFSEDKGV